MFLMFIFSIIDSQKLLIFQKNIVNILRFQYFLLYLQTNKEINNNVKYGRKKEKSIKKFH